MGGVYRCCSLVVFYTNLTEIIEIHVRIAGRIFLPRLFCQGVVREARKAFLRAC